MPVDLFQPNFPEDQLDSNFKLISSVDYFDSAKGIINEIFNSWDGFDGHFVSEFQTTSFNARLWELYLFSAFKSLGFKVERCLEGRPDFCLKKDNKELYVEAVITNPVSGEDDFIPSTFDKEGEEVFFLKMRSSLLKKLKKKYWELQWVKGRPLVLAICPFHSSNALNVTDFEVRKYLYGVSIEKKIENGNVSVNESRVESHLIGEKKLSNYFDIPLVSNISGVIFSNEGTIGKFMRMGYQAGFGNEILTFYYSGSCHDYNPKSTGVRQFMFEIKRDEAPFVDEWKYGLTLFHNQNAQNPIGYELLDNITQGKYESNGGFFAKHINFHPYNAKNLRNVIA